MAEKGGILRSRLLATAFQLPSCQSLPVDSIIEKSYCPPRHHHVSARSFDCAVSQCHFQGMSAEELSIVAPLTKLPKDKEKPMAVRSSNIVAARGSERLFDMYGPI